MTLLYLSRWLGLLLLGCGTRAHGAPEAGSRPAVEPDGGIAGEVFISRWDTRAAVSVDMTRVVLPRVVLPLVEQGKYDFRVAWGDGKSDHIERWNDPAATHEYAEHGRYRVEIEGTLVGWQFSRCSAGVEGCEANDCAREMRGTASIASTVIG
jgi:hypothetical protein